MDGKDPVLRTLLHCSSPPSTNSNGSPPMICTLRYITQALSFRHRDRLLAWTICRHTPAGRPRAAVGGPVRGNCDCSMRVESTRKNPIAQLLTRRLCHEAASERNQNQKYAQVPACTLHIEAGTDVSKHTICQARI